jgi:Flp pilus assembly protein TadG
MIHHPPTFRQPRTPEVLQRPGWQRVATMRHQDTEHRVPVTRAGVAAVELAVVLPLILLFVFACADFGRVMYAYLTVSNAARCGAEYGAMHEFTPYTRSSWESQVQLAVQEEMQQLPGFAAGNLQVTLTTTTDQDGMFQLMVEVNYPFQTIVNWPGVPSQVPLDRKILMRQIR